MFSIFRPAALASALIAAGVMSGVPTMFSCFKLSRTVLRPLKPIAIATIPKATRIAADTNPPMTNTLRISSLRSVRSTPCGSPTCSLASGSCAAPVPPSCPTPNRSAGVPLSDRGIRVGLLVLTQVLSDRVPDELGPSGESQLLHDVRAVCLGRTNRDVELLCDLLVRVPEREQAQHLSLAVGE